MVGAISATPDGKIRIHPTQMKVARLSVKGLLNLFGLDMANLVNTRKTRGISVDDNDIILDPARMLPPPQMRGRITAVRVQGDEIIQIFGKEKRDSPAERTRSNYMAYRGGILRFGRLTMNNADMRLIDADPTDPFVLPAVTMTSWRITQDDCPGACRSTRRISTSFNGFRPSEWRRRFQLGRTAEGGQKRAWHNGYEVPR
jgi:hypothetical protein